MSIAIIGIGALQIYWINWSSKLGKENFESNIHEALNSVSQKLTQQEQQENRAKKYTSEAEAQRDDLNKALFSGIEKRLPNPPSKLELLINQELSRRGVLTEYRYGVFSTSSRLSLIHISEPTRPY